MEYCNMTTAKKDSFGATVQEAANFAKALSHPARIEILRVLAEKKACVCGEVVEELPLAQSTVSQHLKALKETGLISGTVDGPSVCYCLNVNAFKSNLKKMHKMLESIATEGSCC